MKVKVIKGSFGVGDIFEVRQSYSDCFLINLNDMLVAIDKCDAEVVEDVEKSCKTCGNDNNGFCATLRPCHHGSPDGDLIEWRPIKKRNDAVDALVGAIKSNQVKFAGGQTEKQAGKFENIGRSLGELVDDKQQAYGDAITAVEQIMSVLYPNGVKVDQYRDMLLMVRIMDKQCRIAKGDKTAFSESPFRDIAGYGLLGVGHGQ